MWRAWAQPRQICASRLGAFAVSSTSTAKHPPVRGNRREVGAVQRGTAVRVLADLCGGEELVVVVLVEAQLALTHHHPLRQPALQVDGGGGDLAGVLEPCRGEPERPEPHQPAPAQPPPGVAT